MTIYEVAIQLTKQHIGELTATDIAEKYNSDIGAAAGALYKENLANLLKEHQTTDQRKDIGVYVTKPSVGTVRLIGEDQIID